MDLKAIANDTNKTGTFGVYDYEWVPVRDVILYAKQYTHDI